MKKFVVALGAALATMPSTAHADVLITISETGGDVVTTGSGSIDTALFGQNALYYEYPYSALRANGAFYVSKAGPSIVFGGLSGPAAFGPGPGFFGATSASGDVFGIDADYHGLITPTDYTSNALLSFTSTYAGQSFASLGLVVGTYAYTIAGNTITFDISNAVPGVPEPSAWALLILGFGAVGAAARRQRRIASIAGAAA